MGTETDNKGINKMSNQSIINKIRAMLSKTVENGCTEAEAMAALEIAQRMMNEYEVTEDDLKLEGEKAFIEISDMKDTHNIQWRLAYQISQFTETYSFGNKKAVKFAGLKGDVDFAIWLSQTLTMFVQTQLKDFMWKNKLTVLRGQKRNRVINSFIIGCCSGINKKLREMVASRTANPNSTALVVAKKALIDDAVKDLKIGNADNRGRKNIINVAVYLHGRDAGEKAQFGRPVEQGGMLRLK